jgi:hypothetical protein
VKTERDELSWASMWRECYNMRKNNTARKV